MEQCCKQRQGEPLLASVTALAITMAKGKSAEELASLAALFTILGDSLALLALDAPSTQN